jgi:hypothetical protein
MIDRVGATTTPNPCAKLPISGGKLRDVMDDAVYEIMGRHILAVDASGQHERVLR